MARIRLDREGVGEMLKSAPIAAEIRGLADQVADNVRSQGRTVDDTDIHGVAVTIPLPVETYSYETDRAAAGVALDHPAGLGMQAKHGVLTLAASAVGLEVKDKR